ncbi:MULTISPECIES: hypothetical protein [Mycobacteriaceae]|uniref:hypothetical protein n=1 Tax=Mycobacteriaceae TaxID=1762 RepID=UPI000801D464|nr:MULTISPECIES: hypothetical protein [Mycobacteriaceae]MCK0174187.1 hypothetical protein [Mycolicibacterium sp. F2034L]OBB60450.1 hypothetical protein A5757_10270 [Mycobacterium sp. 852013-51886_SCH5428379]
MGIVIGFAPWIVYWILVGNVPFLAAVVVALAVAVAALAVGSARNAPGRTLEIGAVATFGALTVVTLLVDQAFMERWLQPLSTLGIFLVALGGQLVGRPFIREFAAAGQPKDIIETDLFATITTRLTWIWIAAFGLMTVSSAIPPIVQGDATILDTREPLSVVCYWIVPFTVLALAALASRILPERMVADAGDIERKTTFVAYSEAAIDELYYLAQEHANREVGAGQEAYNVKVGGKGTPLVGDEDRQSWPATYKVRERRR